MKISANVKKNQEYLRESCRNCDDIKIRPMCLGENKVDCVIVYIEVTVDNMILEDSMIGKFINHFQDISWEKMKESLEKNSLGISDVKELSTMEDAISGLLSGDAVFFMEGYEKAIKIAGKGYPNLGVSEAEREKVLRGSKEGFSDSVKSNTALIRKRIRSTGLKVEEQYVGCRSHTLVQILYMEDLVYEPFLEELKSSLDHFEIDGIFDSGMVEQLIQENWNSPFPKFQTTERPDRAAMEILDGRIVLMVDNSPIALLLPTTFVNFLQVSEDRYQSFEMISFLRVLRLIAALGAMLLPGLYLAVIRFHTQVLPGNLILSFAQAREGVPFSGIVELLFLELSFELIRESGVRMPGSLGNAIGIVGGLIIGQAAVEANLVSPVVVMVVALTALGSLTIPNQEFSTAFRMLKYVFLFLGGYFGLLGIIGGMYLLMDHLAGLKSFHIPYLTPFVGRELDRGQDDTILRKPFYRLKRRPIYANRKNRVRLRRK
jgi:spore germination protein